MPCPERFKKKSKQKSGPLDTIGWYEDYRKFWERVTKEAKKVKR